MGVAVSSVGRCEMWVGDGEDVLGLPEDGIEEEKRCPHRPVQEGVLGRRGQAVRWEGARWSAERHGRWAPGVAALLALGGDTNSVMCSL